MIDPIGLHGAQLKIFFSLYIEWKTIDRYKAEKSETKKKHIHCQYEWYNISDDYE